MRRVAILRLSFINTLSMKLRGGGARRAPPRRSWSLRTCGRLGRVDDQWTTGAGRSSLSSHPGGATSCGGCGKYATSSCDTRAAGYTRVVATCRAIRASYRGSAPGRASSGWAGLVQTTWRTTADASTSELAARVPYLRARLLRHRAKPGPDVGLLDGAAGVALALHTTASHTPPVSGWDACLLIHG